MLAGVQTLFVLIYQGSCQLWLSKLSPIATIAITGTPLISSPNRQKVTYHTTATLVRTYVDGLQICACVNRPVCCRHVNPSKILNQAGNAIKGAGDQAGNAVKGAGDWLVKGVVKVSCQPVSFSVQEIISPNFVKVEWMMEQIKIVSVFFCGGVG